MVHSRHLILALSLAGLVPASCIPAHAEFLRLPVQIQNPDAEKWAIVSLPLAELALHVEDLQPQSISLYQHGRQPLPHALVDADGDGITDTVLTKIPNKAGEFWILVVSPGPQSDARLPEGGSRKGVTVNFKGARR